MWNTKRIRRLTLALFFLLSCYLLYLEPNIRIVFHGAPPVCSSSLKGDLELTHPSRELIYPFNIFPVTLYTDATRGELLFLFSNFNPNIIILMALDNSTERKFFCQPFSLLWLVSLWNPVCHRGDALHHVCHHRGTLQSCLSTHFYVPAATIFQKRLFVLRCMLSGNDAGCSGNLAALNVGSVL